MHYALYEGKSYLVSASKVASKTQEQEDPVSEKAARKAAKRAKKAAKQAAKQDAPQQEPEPDMPAKSGGIERLPEFWPAWIKGLAVGSQYALSEAERQRFVTVMGSANSPFTRETKTENGKEPVLIYTRKRTSRHPQSDGVTLKYYPNMRANGTVYRVK